MPPKCSKCNRTWGNCICGVYKSEWSVQEYLTRQTKDKSIDEMIRQAKRAIIKLGASPHINCDEFHALDCIVNTFANQYEGK